jgi:hypothetical protein
MPGWFKGMEVIIHEHRLWPEKGLPAHARISSAPLTVWIAAASASYTFSLTLLVRNHRSKN